MTYYYCSRGDNSYDLILMRLIDEVYTRHPYYGVRKMTAVLKRSGHEVNVKRIRRLYWKMGIEAVYPKPNLSKASRENKTYPYLLKGLSITKPDQVWAADITYIRLKNGFIYLAAIMDWYSRYVISFDFSTTLQSEFCVDALIEALKVGTPGVFNTDQGVQFTDIAFIAQLRNSNIRISMDGKGRASDNIFVERLWRTVKYECIYLNDYETVRDTIFDIGRYFIFYNTERPHQSLGYKTPAEVYFNGFFERKIDQAKSV